MSISIEYLNNLSDKNNNIVIFVSKLSQLKSLNLPFDLQKHLNNKDFVNRINKTLYAEINNHNTLFDSIVNIKICLITLNHNYLIETGVMVCDKFKFQFDKNTQCSSLWTEIFYNYQGIAWKDANKCCKVHKYKSEKYKSEKYKSEKYKSEKYKSEKSKSENW